MKFNVVIIASIFIYLINRFLIGSTGIVFIDFYLDDLIAPVILLYLTERVLCFVYKKKTISLQNSWIFFTAAYLSVVFEILLPKYYPGKYYGDMGDVLAYFAGALVYLLFVNPLEST